MKNIRLVNFVKNLVLLVLNQTSRLLCARSAFAVLLFIILHLTFNTEHCVCQWLQISNGISSNKTIHSIAFYNNYLYAGTEGSGIYLSTNNGNLWTQTSLNNLSVYSFAFSGNNIFAGTLYSGVYISTNNGGNWTQTTLNNQLIWSLAITGNNIFAGSAGEPYGSGGVYISTNNGSFWTPSGLNTLNIRAFVVSGNDIFAGTAIYPYGSGGVYLSSNNGITWILTTMNNKNIRCLAINGNYIAAGTDNDGVYLSTNGGNIWSQTSLNNKDVRSVAIYGNIIIAGTWNFGIYVSSDNGINWIQKNEGFSSLPSIASLLIANNYIFAGTYNQSVWRRPLSDFTDIKNVSIEIPSAFSLEQNYPNPFNQSTMFIIQCSMAGWVKVIVYDISGKEAATLVNEKLNPGTYEVRFDAGNLPSGIYFYKMETEKFSQTKKLILLK